MAPAFRGRRLGRDRAKLRMADDTQGATRGDRRHSSLVAVQRGRLVGIARELGDGAERAEAPAGFGVGKSFGEKLQQIGHHITPWLRGVGLGGGV